MIWLALAFVFYLAAKDRIGAYSALTHASARK